MGFIVDSFVEATKQAGWERYCQLAAGMAMGYEYLITFDKEIDFFWAKRWSFGKVMFLWSRYYGLSYNIGNSVIFMQSKPSDSNKFFHWQNTGALLQVVTTHIILELRLYAMYESSRKLLILFIFITCGEIAAMGYIFNAAPVGAVDTNNPAPGVFICDDADPPNRHYISYYYTTSLITEGIFVSLAVYKAFVSSKSGGGGRIIQVLARDSVRYFVIILAIYVANQIIWLVNDITINELATGFGLSMASVLGNRLMMNVRESYYNHQVYTMTKQSTMIPLPSTGRNSKRTEQDTFDSYDSDTKLAEDYELTTFSEGRGF